ncbi:streptophobe family protein [Streptomyces sp. NPDC005931]|uniref:streptophobe family protein n=1 Tax=Streptomyces sp. NPDC005931 TaxID=3364737 RepID=UPI00368CEF11
MSAVTSAGTARYATPVPWADVVLSAVAAVSWALIGMAGTAALGLRLLDADAAGSLGPMTAAVVALGAGGSVTPSGDVSVFGLSGAEASTAIDIAPLGVSLVGALLLAYFFLRSLRAAGVVVSPAELLARAGTVVALFVAAASGLVWAGHDVVTVDGGSLGLDDLPGGGGGVEVPGLGDLGDIGGLLPDRVGDLVDAEAAVGFTVDTVPTLLGGLCWSAGVLLVALLASRRTPLPRGWDAVHRVVRPAASALVTVGLVAVAAGLAAAAYAAIGDDHPRRIAGAALLGAPNGVWLGLPLGLFVPWDGRASGALLGALPDPVDDLLRDGTDRTVTLGTLAELDERVWLLAVAAAVLMLLAGVLVGVRTPAAGSVGAVGAGGSGGSVATGGSVGTGGSAGSGGSVGAAAAGVPGARGRGGVRGSGALGFAGRCAVSLGAATALALPLLVWLTGVSVGASLSVLGFDAFGAGLDLHGHLGMALLLGAAWGGAAGGAGALLATASGAAGRRAAPLARGDVSAGTAAGAPAGSARREEGGSGARERGPAEGAGHPEGTGHPSDAGRGAEGAGYLGATRHAERAGHRGDGGPPETALSADGTRRAGSVGDAEGAGAGPEPARPVGPAGPAGPAGPYTPAAPYRPPNPVTNPYLRLPREPREREDTRRLDRLREPEDARPGREGVPPDRPAGTGDGGARPAGVPRTGEDPHAEDSFHAEDSPRGDDGSHAADSPSGQDAASSDDIYGAPTVIGPVGPPPRGPRRGPPRRERKRSPLWPDEGPPPPPPPPAPRKP